MKFILSKTAIASVFSTISAIAIASQPTQAATVFWDLEFFGDSGEQIGTGEFSYDDSSPFEDFFVSFEEPINFNNGVAISKSDNWYALQSFTVDIAGVTWTLEGQSGTGTVNINGEIETFSPYAQLYAWQPPETDIYPGSNGGPRSVAYGRSPLASIREDWSLTDTAPQAPPFLALSSASEGQSQASFFAFYDSASFTGGSWTATRRDGSGGGTGNETVPEPSALLGLALVTSIGASLRKRQEINK
jgi:hypothetical protein